MSRQRNQFNFDEELSSEEVSSILEQAGLSDLDSLLEAGIGDLGADDIENFGVDSIVPGGDPDTDDICAQTMPQSEPCDDIDFDFEMSKFEADTDDDGEEDAGEAPVVAEAGKPKNEEDKTDDKDKTDMKDSDKKDEAKKSTLVQLQKYIREQGYFIDPTALSSLLKEDDEVDTDKDKDKDKADKKDESLSGLMKRLAKVNEADDDDKDDKKDDVKNEDGDDDDDDMTEAKRQILSGFDKFVESLESSKFIAKRLNKKAVAEARKALTGSKKNEADDDDKKDDKKDDDDKKPAFLKKDEAEAENKMGADDGKDEPKSKPNDVEVEGKSESSVQSASLLSGMFENLS